MDSDTAMRFIWFDIGDLPRYDFNWSALPSQRLPYPHCAIVGKDSRGDAFLVLAEQGDETTILLMAWAFLPDRYISTQIFALEAGENGCQFAPVEGEGEITREQAAGIVGILAEFLAKANPIGYSAEPRPKSLTNKARAAKGKPPIVYDWHTVEIAPPSPKTEPQGGTHASPRQHDRRGHWRTLPNGNRVWVRNCVVGDPTKGRVWKDYRVDV